MRDCWILTDLVAPGVIFFCFLVMSLVAFGLLAENRRLLVVCLPNGFTIRQRSTWPPGLPPLPMGED